MCPSVLMLRPVVDILARPFLSNQGIGGGSQRCYWASANESREDKKFREIFDRAGLVIVRTELQNGMPKGLLPVRSYALKPQPKA